MAVCARCNKTVGFLGIGGVNWQQLCRTCEQEVRMQHLSNIRNGSLPIIRASIHLDTDEICHLELPATYLKVNSRSMKPIPGRFVATSKRLHFLAATSTYTIGWNNVLRVARSKGNGMYREGVYLELTRQSGTGFYAVSDPDIVEASLDTLTRMAKRQIVGSRPDAGRIIPQDVKTAVWQRDRGQCRQCGAQDYLEFDHIIPFSKGGASTYNNVQLLCRRCNQMKGARI